ncbi:MAG: Nif11-like leader peptide family RiPP precursor [Oscillospiraceae bacterium]
MDEQAVLKAVEDQAFLEKLVALDSPEEVQAAFKQDKGIDITIDDIVTIQKVVESKMEGELNEDDLENVAGGIAVSAGIAIGTAVVAGVIKLGDAVNNWTRRRW